MKNIFRQSVRAATMLGLAGFAGASVQAANLVDTHATWNNSNSVQIVTPSSSKSRVEGTEVGQTFKTPQNQYLTSVSFWLFPRIDGNLAYSAKVYEWDDVAKQLVGNALYQSSSAKALNSTDKQWQDLSFDTGATLLKAGHSYVAFLHPEIYGSSSFTNDIAHLSGDNTSSGDRYDGGYALYRQFMQNNVWNTWGATDLAFRATVAPVPEPQTYAMLLAGLAVVGWRARSRRQG